MDGFVLLTPLLVLVVILLLGFTGCDIVLGLQPPGPGTLTLRALVPSQFIILEARFEWTPPGASTPQSKSDSELHRRDDGPDIVELSHVIGTPAKGGWEVCCYLRVRQPTPTGGGPERADDCTGTLTVDSAWEASSYIFVTSGSPAGLDFKVLCDGLVSD